MKFPNTSPSPIRTHVLWHGHHLDGTLTVSLVEDPTRDVIVKANAPIEVHFVLVGIDYDFVGSEHIYNNTASVLLLLDRITAAYLATQMELRDRKVSDGAYTQ